MHKFTVPTGCHIVGPDWSLSGLVVRISHISVKKPRVKAPENLNTIGIVSHVTVVALLYQPGLNEMALVSKPHLEKTSLPDYLFPWKTANLCSSSD